MDAKKIIVIVLSLIVVGIGVWAAYVYFATESVSINEVRPAGEATTMTADTPTVPSQTGKTLPTDFPDIPVYTAAVLQDVNADEPQIGPYHAIWLVSASLTTTASWYQQEFGKAGWTEVRGMEKDLKDASVLHGVYSLGDTALYMDLTSVGATQTKVAVDVTVKPIEDLDHIPEPAAD